MIIFLVLLLHSSEELSILFGNQKYIEICINVQCWKLDFSFCGPPLLFPRLTSVLIASFSFIITTILSPSACREKTN